MLEPSTNLNIKLSEYRWIPYTSDNVSISELTLVVDCELDKDGVVSKILVPKDIYSPLPRRLQNAHFRCLQEIQAHGPKLTPEQQSQLAREKLRKKQDYQQMVHDL